jgi:hypothetical protein
MPGYVMTVLNPVFCTHGGKGTPIPPMGRVVASGLGVITLAHAYVIAGCTFPAMTLGAQPPCVAGTLTVGTTRVLSMGVPIGLVPTSAAGSMGLPNPTPLIIAPAGQIRVQGM